jgi:hypothetical protein
VRPARRTAASAAWLPRPGLDRADRDGKLGGHLAVGEALQIEQEHGVALAVGELGHGGPDPGRQVGELRALIGAGVGRRPVRHLADPAGRSFGTRQAEEAPRHVQRDAAEPRAEPARRAQPVQAHHGRDGGLLGGVPGQVG